MYDTIIIGGGIAGLTAALYAQRREMQTLLITKDIGGQINWAGEIENYPGFDLIAAWELTQKLEAQAKKAGFEIRLEGADKIEKINDKHFIIHTANGQYETKTIIFALGLIPRRLNAPGEKELSGKGVSYCANCDGPFFKGKRVAVVGGGNSGLDAAEVLSKIASEVHLINRGNTFKAFDTLVNTVKAKENITIHMNSSITSINGDAKVESITISENNSSENIIIDGVFIEIGRLADSDLVAGLAERDQWGQIIIDHNCQTSQPGIFAAGDITTVEFKQLTIAAGQGTIAALAAYQYLQSN
jgi:thioredoxin-disulfide reductase